MSELLQEGGYGLCSLWSIGNLKEIEMCTLPVRYYTLLIAVVVRLMIG